MTIRIALFRGINVGGRHVLPMKGLQALLERLGARAVKTYIQSGNVIFQAPEGGATTLSVRIEDAVEEEYGFRPRVLVLTTVRLDKAMAGNPFPGAEAAPKTLHVYFLACAPDEPDLDKLERLRTATERYVLDGDVFYLHTPDGFGRSKLAIDAEKALGVAATARNWRTVGKLAEMVRDLG